MDGPEAGSRKKRECAVEQVRGRRFGSLIRIHRVGLNDFSAVLESVRNRGSQQRGRHSCASVLRCHDEATNRPHLGFLFHPCVHGWPEYLGSFQSRVTCRGSTAHQPTGRPARKARTPGAAPDRNADFSDSLRSSGDEFAQSLAVRANHRHQHRDGSPLVPNNSSTAAQVAGAVSIFEGAWSVAMDPE
jgi:hypothetical protein